VAARPPRPAARQYDPAGQDDLAAELEGGPALAEVLALPSTTTRALRLHDVAEAMAAAEPRGSIVRVRLADGTPVPVISAVPWLPGAGAGDGSAAPALGADTEAVLAELGLDAARVAGLREAGCASEPTVAGDVSEVVPSVSDVIIDCSTCAVRDLACDDCVVSVLLGSPPGELESTEVAALAVLAESGLVPPLRLVSGE
jgi:hypothetical protein